MKACYVCRDFPDRGPVREHVRVGGIRQRAVTFAGLDAASQFAGLPGTPDGAEVVVVLAQISHGLRSYTAGPDVPVRRDLRRRDPSHAGNHLTMLAERFFHDLVVLTPESLGNLGNPGKMLITYAFEQRVDGNRVPLGRRRNAETYGIEFYALLGDLSDVRVRLQL